MKLATRELLLELVKSEGSPCVSLYLPTHRAGRETQQDPIRFRNLLKHAYEKTGAAGLTPQAQRDLLAPVEEIASDHMFWRYQTEGLAVLRTPDALHRLQTLWTVPELCVTGSRLHLKPLLRAIHSDEDFLILCLTGHGVRLLHGDRISLVDITPESADAIFNEEPGDRRRGGLQMHSAEGAIYHGAGGSSDIEKTALIERFRRADREIASTVASLGYPIVLGGVESTLVLYRPLSSFATQILEKEMHGNCDDPSSQALRESGWLIAAEHFQGVEDAAKAGFDEWLARGLASTDLDSVLAALADGRVERLFVAVGRQVWGTFDPVTRRAQISRDPSAMDADLLNEAAIGALHTGAKVYALRPERMPQEAAVAAVFRY